MDKSITSSHYNHLTAVNACLIIITVQLYLIKLNKYYTVCTSCAKTRVSFTRWPLAESEHDTSLPITDSYDKSSFLAMLIMIYHCLPSTPGGRTQISFNHFSP